MANWNDLFGVSAPTLAGALTTLNQPGSHTVVSITDTATLDSTAFGKLHKVAETSATFDITLPSASGNAGKRIGFLGDNTTNLTKAIRVLPASGTVDNQNWLMIVAERLVIVECDGTNWKIAAQNEFKLAANLEIDISNAMSIATINEWLAYAPKNINGKTLTFDFNNGTGSPKTYTITTPLVLSGYFGGNLVLSGSSDSGLSTAQVVHFDGSGNEVNIMNISNLSCNTSIYGFKLTVKGDVNYLDCMYITNCSGYVYISSNYFVSTSTAKGIGIQVFYSPSVSVNSSYFDKFFYAIHAATLAIIYSATNPSTGTNSDYGLVAGGTSVIGKYSTQPTGSTANETAQYGSEIRS